MVHRERHADAPGYRSERVDLLLDEWWSMLGPDGQSEILAMQTGTTWLPASLEPWRDITNISAAEAIVKLRTFLESKRGPWTVAVTADGTEPTSSHSVSAILADEFGSDYVLQAESPWSLRFLVRGVTAATPEAAAEHLRQRVVGLLKGHWVIAARVEPSP
jgi:hypothetical protein